jgi:hypothetical protein
VSTLRHRLAAGFYAALIILGHMLAASFASDPNRDNLDRAIAVLQPFAGESVPGVDTSTLDAKVMCGYQGWFTTPGDGSDRGWSHYERRGKFEPGRCNIDLWPDTSELDADEKIPTAFRNADGSMAPVFSSHNRKTVLRHFRWMRDYGIDGVFVQRFAVETIHPRNLFHFNTVLTHCREGANLNGRAYAVMYDLSGLQADQMQRVIEDWKRLVSQMKLGRDPADKAYLRHKGKPVVAVWGVGFNDSRRYTLADCETLIRFLKDDPEAGGCTVMVGTPIGWRTLDRDCSPDPKLHDVLKLADIISPWTVGRFGNAPDVENHVRRWLQPDMEWCQKNGKDYLPVAFPGFSWHNMRPEAKSDQIPRLKGQFLWSQYAAYHKAGATMFYQAMFDEMDEATAIFKCTNTPPVGASQFLNLEGLPSDHYLWLTGMGGKLLRGEVKAEDGMPARE